MSSLKTFYYYSDESPESKKKIKNIMSEIKASMKKTSEIVFCHPIFGKKTEFPIYVDFKLLGNSYSIVLNKNTKEKQTTIVQINPQIAKSAKSFFFENSSKLTHAHLPAVQFLFGNLHKKNFSGLFKRYKKLGAKKFEKFNFNDLDLNHKERENLAARQKMLFELYNTYGSFLLAIHEDKKISIAVANDLLIGVLFFMHWELGNLINGFSKSNPVLPSLIKIVTKPKLKF